MPTHVPDIPPDSRAARGGLHSSGFDDLFGSWRPVWYRRVRAQLGLQGLLVVVVSVILLTTVAACSVLMFGAMLQVLASHGLIGDTLSPVVEYDVIRMVMFKGALVAIAGCVVAVALIALVTYRLFRPVRQLNAATKQLSNGAIETKVHIHGDHVLAELAENFNHMAEVVNTQRRELLAANSSLEATVHMRTAQLEAANEQLSSEISEKDDFLRAVSHDLGAPLRNIDGLLSLLLKDQSKLPADAVDRLQRVGRNSRHAMDLIGELLTLAQVKRQVPTFTDVDLTPIADAVGELFNHELVNQKIDLIIQRPLPVIRGDALRIRQALQNLVDNAIKYMGPPRPDAPRQIIISGGDAAGGVYLSVADTGMGIAHADQAKIFCVFRRGTTPSVAAIPGRGVGLSWVKSVAELHGGTIRLCSEPGAGSTFRLFFPSKPVAQRPIGRVPSLPPALSSRPAA